MEQEPSGRQRSMRESPPEGTDTSLSEALRSLGENLARLLSEHVSLAEAELKREGERLLRGALLVGAGLLWASVGYIGLMGALVAALAPAFGVALAATIVGGVNLIAGALALAFAAKRLKETERPLPGLEAELSHDVEDVGRELSGPQAGPH